MATLSISRAWEESKAQFAADGRLMAIVAAALIVLPGLIVEVIDPGTTRGSDLAGSALVLISSLLALIGQLSIIRLAMTPAVSVGEAIGHGARRMPVYLLAAIILTIALLFALIPFGVVLYAAGVPIGSGNEQEFVKSPVALLLSCLFLALVIFVAMRMLMSSPVASEESAGPFKILRRSWELTAGHWWRLFGFLVTFVIGALVAVLAVNWVAIAVGIPLLGPLGPMSATALVVGLLDSIANGVLTVVLAVMLARIYVQLRGGEPGRASVPSSGT